MKQKTNLKKLAIAYYNAKMQVISLGYANEIDWQEDLQLENLTEQSFLRETAWVVLSSGMSVKVITKIFPKISDVFFQWDSSRKIADNKKRIRNSALQVFSYEKKIDSILEISNCIHQNGFRKIVDNIQQHGVEFISTFPFMGPATSYHLAKNIGLQVAKPDRHLLRIAYANGYKCPNEMCNDLASITDEKVSVIDIVFWRYAAMNKNYLSLFRPGSETH